MKPSKDNKKTVITTDGETHTADLVMSSDKAPECKKPTNASVVNNISTQRQLLTLAKQFSLEGGLRAADKQLPISERVIRHQQSCEIRYQKNLESIIEQALSYSSEDEITDRADIDWFNNFISLAKNVSNTTMQALWAKILAGEVARPGSFSLKALIVFKNMSMHDAKLLAKAHRLAIKDQSGINMRIITGCYQKPSLLSLLLGKKEYLLNLAEFGLNYSDILALSDNQLIFSHEAETRPLTKTDQLNFDFHTQPLSIMYKTSEACLKFYKFTAIGNELAQLLTDTPNNDYFDKLKLCLSPLFQLN